MSDKPFYYGSAENKLNAKGQVAIPARFRAALPEAERTQNYVLIRGEDSCLYLYTHAQFESIKNNARHFAIETGNSAFFRSFMAEAHAVDVDTQGRFVLPASLQRAAGIRGPGVLFIGVDDRIEIWEPSLYQERRSGEDQYEEVRKVAARNIFGGI